MKTTLNKIKSHDPCTQGWKTLLRGLNKTSADNEPLSILKILEISGLDNALWCLQAVDGHDRELRLYAVWCARQAQPWMADPRSVAVLDVAERHAKGMASEAELAAAEAAAWAAYAGASDVAATYAAKAAKAAAAKAAKAAAYAAAEAATYAARAAAYVASEASAYVARAATYAAANVAEVADAGAAYAAAKAAQRAGLIRICEALEPT